MIDKKINIIWRDIDSSMIKYLHYSSNGNRSYLGITFKNNYSYVYTEIPLSDVLRMISDKSPGAYFSSNIRTKYSYRHLGILEEQSPLEKIGISVSGEWNI